MMKNKKFRWIYKLETKRWQFWAWMMDHFPKLYRWCNEHLPFDTLPF